MENQTSKLILDKLKTLESYRFECEAGNLENCLDYIELKEMIEAVNNG